MRLTLLADGDADVLAEWGNIATLTHRVTRIIEGAYESEAVVDELRLALLFLPTLRALRHRLKALWAQGAHLPVAGASHHFRRQWQAPRGALAVER